MNISENLHILLILKIKLKVKGCTEIRAKGGLHIKEYEGMHVKGH